MPHILVTLGDPAGIGPEITAKALGLFSLKERSSFCVIGGTQVWDTVLDPSISFIASDFSPPPLIGQESALGGLCAISALDTAIALLKTGKYKGLVTAPLSKNAVILAGNKLFHGHTDYLGEAFSSKPEMVFYSPKWSVLLVTVHVPLSLVPSLITKNRIENALRQAWVFQQKYYKSTKPLAICGLNPHAGENGSMGKEEIDIFLPVIQKLSLEKIFIDGPFAGDTIFRQAEAGKYQMVISLYHDQGLTAFKILHFDDGINVSYGLPFLRSSPDHGTAFDIAGKNSANPIPMYNALLFALKNCL